jgi:hypothetical protein
VQILLEPLIGLLTSAIGVWVESGGDVLLNVQEVAQFLREVRDESGVMVADDFARNAKPWH